MVLDPWRTMDHGREQIRSVAARVGYPERGEELVAELDSALVRTRTSCRAAGRILIYHRRGWVPGPDSFMGELARHMGFTLHQETLGLSRGGLVRLEAVVATPPITS